MEVELRLMLVTGSGCGFRCGFLSPLLMPWQLLGLMWRVPINEHYELTLHILVVTNRVSVTQY